jgi:hypothetical protein
MRHLIAFLCLMVAACSAEVPMGDVQNADPIGQKSQALKACEKKIPRMTPTECAGYGIIFSRGSCADSATDFSNTFAPGTHKSPPYSLCPAPHNSNWSSCLNDFFRSPSSWDNVAGTADYEALMYNGVSPFPANAAYVEAMDSSLQHQMTSAQWSNVSSISYIDVNIAWSTIDFEQIALMFEDTITYETRAGQLNGNIPNGALNFIHMTQKPTGVAWQLSDGIYYHVWLIENDNAMDSTHRGIFIHSITETFGYQYNGTSCP